ncbi:MAG: hypothetical protein JWO87_3898 [Phycisphaerales bacterium]|jgi:hypothetical protein|nr:hypothetical protein [Phycisphaerales bacterium]MDB5302235.1 hypothetical protein [Phycisphaerales bacterium]MDB5302528.1 hypothetical protein [Phycisphaerales bacterium]
MRKLVSLVALAALVGFSYAPAFAKEDAKEVKLKGTAVCAKCELKETEKCQDALKVKEDGKEVVYLLTDNAVAKKFHGTICKTTKEDVTVTGTVSEKDGKKIITATKID